MSVANMAATARLFEGTSVERPTADEIDAIIDPLVSKRFAETDPEWIRIVRDNARRQRRARIRRRVFGWLPGRHRTQASVAANYTRQWLDRPLDSQVSFTGSVVPFRWRSEGLLARAVALKRVHLLFLMRAIAALQPRTVLEVGAGNGFNLFMLAARFPAIRFVGVELTAGGAAAAAATGRQGPLSDAVQRFSPEPLESLEPFDRVHVIEGNAAALPFSDARFDLVFTVLALEQMEPIRDRALRELRRVARAHVAMMEPFHEWNADGIARDFVIANDYFSGRIADLPRFGLQPILATADMPSKLVNRPGFVVCNVG